MRMRTVVKSVSALAAVAGLILGGWKLGIHLYETGYQTGVREGVNAGINVVLQAAEAQGFGDFVPAIGPNGERGYRFEWQPPCTNRPTKVGRPDSIK